MVFEPLLQHELKKVVDIQMKSIIARVARKDISLVFSDDVPEVILSESYDQVST